MNPRIYLSPPHMGDDERRLLLEAFDSNWIAPLGPHVDAFEQEVAARLGVPHAAALSSGTAALHLALRLLGVGPGDRVIAPTLTFVASVSPIVHVGATPIFLDVHETNWNLDPELLALELARLRQAGTPAKAVIAVDLYGQCADYDRLTPLCAEFDVPLVEDAAEALGATFQGRAAGSFGALGVLSFNGNKIITTSGGGMLVSERRDWIERARHLATQAREPAPHYEHAEIGFNYRLSNLLAAVGRGQLRVLDERLRARRENFAFYGQAFANTPGIQMAPRDPRGEANDWLSCILVDEAAFGASPRAIREHLAAHDIESRPVWKPMHLQPVFREVRRVGGSVAESLFTRGLCLPSGSSLRPEQRAQVAELVLATPGAAGRQSSLVR